MEDQKLLAAIKEAIHTMPDKNSIAINGQWLGRTKATLNLWDHIKAIKFPSISSFSAITLKDTAYTEVLSLLHEAEFDLEMKISKEVEKDFLREFEEEYQNFVSDLMNAGPVTYERKLKDFYNFLDISPISSSRIKELESKVSFAIWYDGNEKTGSSMAGSGTIAWSPDKSVKLAQTLALFRHFSQTDGAYINFCSRFLYAGSKYADMISAINREYFNSFTRELLKDIKNNPPTSNSKILIPASDRIVRLDHNSEEFGQLIKELSFLEEKIIQNNELGAADPDERDRIVAELSAGKALLQTINVRAQATWELLKPCLDWIGLKCAEEAVQSAARWTLITLAKILGFPLP